MASKKLQIINAIFDPQNHLNFEINTNGQRNLEYRIPGGIVTFIASTYGAASFT